MILVAGGTGRLGSLVVHRLVAGGAAVRVLTRTRARAAHLHGTLIEIVEGDVRVASDVQRAVAGADVVVSAVHGFTGPGGVSPASVDHDGNRHLVEAAARAGATMILISVVGASSESPMELFQMKEAAERRLRASGAPWTIVRSTAFLETWIDLIAQTTDRAGRVVVFGRGHNQINFVSVHDVAALVDRVVADPDARGQTIEIGGPENLTLTQLAVAIQAAGPTVSPRHIPRAALKGMSLILRPFWPERARQCAAALALDTMDLRFNPSALRARYADISLTLPSEILALLSRKKMAVGPGTDALRFAP
jgi:NADH dehydrogenase